MIRESPESRVIWHVMTHFKNIQLKKKQPTMAECSYSVIFKQTCSFIVQSTEILSFHLSCRSNLVNIWRELFPLLSVFHPFRPRSHVFIRLSDVTVCCDRIWRCCVSLFRCAAAATSCQRGKVDETRQGGGEREEVR